MAERTVRFFEIVSDDEDGLRFPNDLDFDSLRSAVQDLPDDEAYVQLDRMEVLGSSFEPLPGRGRKRQVPLIALDRITRDVHLRIERRRNYRPLVLGDDETLAEPTFFSVFPHNVLGMMRNSGSAPGPASFRDYVNRAGLFGVGINVVPLADANAIRALTDVDVLTRFDLAVGPDVAADAFDDVPSIAGAIRSVRDQLGAVSIEVIVKVDRRRSSEATDRALSDVRQAVTGPSRGLLTKAQIAYRSLEEGRADTYDFINEAVALPVVVELNDQTGQPTEPSAAEAVATAYDALHDDIASALKSTS